MLPATWLRDNVARLDTLDPDAPLDDLEPLREIVGDARIVAIGENAHFVREFTLARQRITRFLVERCGFSTFAYEFGFSEGFALDRWVRGEGAEADLALVSEAAIAWGSGNLMRFLRGLNDQRDGDAPLGFAGIDLPEAGGTMLPALLPVLDYLREVDADAVPLAESAVATAERCAVKSVAAAASVWAELDSADLDGQTATLARLLLRFRSLQPSYVERSSQPDYDIALRRLEAAVHTDHMLHVMTAMFSGSVLSGDMSVRDRFMAESVRWHLERSDPDTRIVLAAHNNHIQKTPVSYGDMLTTLPMGQHLAQFFGADYRAVAATSTADHTVDMELDDTAEVGFTVVETPLPLREPGSIETAALDAGIELGLVDLGTAPESATKQIDYIQSQSGYLHTPVADAFDAVLVIPTVTLEENLRI